MQRPPEASLFPHTHNLDHCAVISMACIALSAPSSEVMPERASPKARLTIITPRTCRACNQCQGWVRQHNSAGQAQHQCMWDLQGR